MSQCKKQVGWPPPRFQQLTLNMYNIIVCFVWLKKLEPDVDLFFILVFIVGVLGGWCCFGRKRHGRNLCSQNRHYVKLKQFSIQFKIKRLHWKKTPSRPVVSCSHHIITSVGPGQHLSATTWKQTCVQTSKSKLAREFLLTLSKQIIPMKEPLLALGS